MATYTFSNNLMHSELQAMITAKCILKQIRIVRMRLYQQPGIRFHNGGLGKIFVVGRTVTRHNMN